METRPPDSVRSATLPAQSDSEVPTENARSEIPSTCTHLQEEKSEDNHHEWQATTSTPPTCSVMSVEMGALSVGLSTRLPVLNVKICLKWYHLESALHVEVFLATRSVTSECVRNNEVMDSTMGTMSETMET